MDAAARFFISPWRLVGGTKTLWFARYEAVRGAQIKAAQKQMKELEKLRK